MIKGKKKRVAKFIAMQSNTGKNSRDLNCLDEDGYVWVYMTQSGNDRGWLRLNPRRIIPKNQRTNKEVEKRLKERHRAQRREEEHDDED